MSGNKNITLQAILIWLSAICVFSAVVIVVTMLLREKIRNQIIQRDAEVIHGVILTQISIQDFQTNDLELTQNTILDLLLETSRLKGVVALRLFDQAGVLIEAFPLTALGKNLEANIFETVRNLQPTSKFVTQASLSDYFLDPTSVADRTNYPIVEVTVPLFQSDRDQLLGIAQYIIEGTQIANEFHTLDKHLILMATIAVGTGLLILGIVIFFTFRKLAAAQNLLTLRSQHLLEANAELTLALKTSAIGNITAHLIHGLNNPLSGLRFILEAQKMQNDGRIEERSWEAIQSSMKEMQDMIEEITSVLKQNESHENFTIELNELRELILNKAFAVARKHRVQFIANSAPEGSIDSNRANIIMLILINLIGNAIEATPKGKLVEFTIKKSNDKFTFQISDEGEGIPESVQKNLFKPNQSTKKWGNGIGLVITYELANQIGAQLLLISTGPHGTKFQLVYPAVQDLKHRELSFA